MTEKNTVQQNVSLLGLVALTVTTVIGAGVFNLPRDLAKSVAPGPALIALVFASIAFAVFVYCLKYLQDHYPDLDAGIFSFREQGFGKFIGFLSCVGYWLSIVVGNISLGVLSVSSLGYFIPMFRGGNNIPSLILLSVILWVFYYICASGARNASLVNTVICNCSDVSLADLLNLWSTFTSTSFKNGSTCIRWHIRGSRWQMGSNSNEPRYCTFSNGMLVRMLFICW